MSHSINWDMLENQYYSDGTYRDSLSKMVTIIDDAFAAGQNFMKDFNRSLLELTKDIQNANAAFVQNHYHEHHPLNESRTAAALLLSDTNHNHNKTLFDHNIDNNNNNCTLRNKTLSIDAKIEDHTAASVDDLNRLIKKSTLTRLMKYILPHRNLQRLHATKVEVNRNNWWENEALQFMRGMMDECTHLKNFSIPYDTSLVICVCAKDDAYVPREGCSSLEDIWPGVEVRYVDAGHVSAYVLHQKLFR